MNQIKNRMRIALDKPLERSSISVKQNDTNTRVICFDLVCAGQIYKLDDTSKASIKGIKPDGTIFYNDCVIDDNEIQYTLTNQSINIAGNVRCELQLFGKNGEMITSAQFTINVYDNLFGDKTIESADELGMIQRLIADIEQTYSTLDEHMSNIKSIIESINELEVNVSKKIYIGDMTYSENDNILNMNCPNFTDANIGTIFICRFKNYTKLNDYATFYVNNVGIGESRTVSPGTFMAGTIGIFVYTQVESVPRVVCVDENVKRELNEVVLSLQEEKEILAEKLKEIDITDFNLKESIDNLAEKQKEDAEKFNEIYDKKFIINTHECECTDAGTARSMNLFMRTLFGNDIKVGTQIIVRFRNNVHYLENSELIISGSTAGKLSEMECKKNGCIIMRFANDTEGNLYPEVIFNSNDINKVFQSVSNGKELIASAITDKGVSTLANATFQTMAENISNISSSEKTVSETFNISFGKFIKTVNTAIVREKQETKESISLTFK